MARSASLSSGKTTALSHVENRPDSPAGGPPISHYDILRSDESTWCVYKPRRHQVGACLRDERRAALGRDRPQEPATSRLGGGDFETDRPGKVRLHVVEGVAGRKSRDSVGGLRRLTTTMH